MRADRGHNHGMVFLRCEARDGDRADDSDFCNSNGVERNVPPDRDIHLVIDNAGTHKTKLIRDWFAKRPRWHIHFTPTSASWINQVERFFALLTEKQIRRGVHRSTQALEADIQAHIDAHNAEPKPFRRTKSADDILAAIIRFCLLTLQGDALQRTSEIWNSNSSAAVSTRSCSGRTSSSQAITAIALYSRPLAKCIVPMATRPCGSSSLLDNSSCE